MRGLLGFFHKHLRHTQHLHSQYPYVLYRHAIQPQQQEELIALAALETES